MPDDHIRYDLLAQQALRGVVRTVLADVAKKGLPGEHHFKITFNTVAPGVRLSDRLRAQYPETMTIILQHQFWDLAVGERGFEVGLSFGGITERLSVPFDSIVAFYDPAVQFGFQFEAIDAAAAGERGDAAKAAPTREEKTAPAREDKTARKSAALPAGKSAAGKKSEPAAPSAKTAEPPSGGDDKPDGGGEVVRLDRFRKK
ncbi:MAG: ClpXP protease specificity-enhancing factor SspB [Xanthobacteraceae bacterium]|jgi:uncharacterized protein